MVDIQPFPGIFYRGVRLEDVLAPPYDVIPPALQEALYARHPRNIVRVILNRTPGDAGYAEAGECFRAWQRDGTLAVDAAPALYLLEQSFSWEGRPAQRLGLLARFRVEDPERGSILPHEQTRSGPRQDRWRVLQATRANFSPIFMMFPDPQGRVAARAAESMRGEPLASYADDAGVVHRVFRIGDAAAIQDLRQTLAGVKAYIADGHHRYATALRRRDAVGADGAWTLGYLTPMEAPGLLVLPYHRILAGGPSKQEAWRALAGHFRLDEVRGAAPAARAAARSAAPYAFGLAWPDASALVAEALPAAEALLATEAPASLRALDSYFFHQAVLPKLGIAEEAVRYVHSLGEAEQALAQGECGLAALLRGTPVRQIVAVAEARCSMPAKSTFFHPKLPSGLVIHPLVA